MANLVFDFLHNYHAGERRDSEPANAYQYDEGHVIEAVVPVVVTSCEIHYWIRGMEKAEAYAPDSITPNADGTCTILGHVPNEYFQTNGELRVYIVVTDGDASLTTYEGRIQVCQRSMPDDYVDDDPDNEATRVLTEAREAAATATAAAETCEEVQESIPEDYSQLSDDVSDLKDGLTAVESDVTDLKEDYTTILDSAYVTDTASGSIASFPDGADNVPVKSLTVDIEPVQDLHGQANPYPAGGGKNKFQTTGTNVTIFGISFTVNTDGSVTAKNVSGHSGASQFECGHVVLPSGTYKVNGISGGSGSTVYIELLSGSYSGTRILYITDGDNTMTIEAETDVYVKCVVATQGLPNLNDTKTFYPMIRLSTVSDATFAPYENICPITGHTSAVVTRTGENLFDFKSDYSDWVGGYIKTDGTVYGTTPTAPAYERTSPFISIKGGTTYTFSVNIDTTSQKSMNWAFYDSDKNFISGTYDGQYSGNPIIVNAPSTATYFRVSMRTYNIAKDCQLEVGSSATSYEPYQGQTVTIDLDGTRYGGTLDVTTGVLTVDRAIVDLGTLTYTYDSASKRFGTQSNAIPIKPISGATVLSNMICSQYKTVTGQNQYDDVTLDASISQGGGSSAIIRIRDTAYTDAIAFKTAMNGVQLCYELATPTTVQLTAQQLSTLLGQNNIWADTGNVEVEYRADTALYIQKMLNA